MTNEEMNRLIDELVKCELPLISIQNKTIAIFLKINDIIKHFK